MEDLIYFILLIAWVVFAFYRRTQKKSAQSRKLAQPESGRDFKPATTLEDILFGEEEAPATRTYPRKASWEEEGEYTPEPVETSFEKEYNLRGISSVEERVAPVRTNEIRRSDLSKDEISDDDNMKESTDENFDLRRAVIYAEILNRPYI